MGWQEVPELKELRRTLVKAEDSLLTIMACRSVYGENGPIYRDGGVKAAGLDGNYLDMLLSEKEMELLGKGGFSSPEEIPFSDELMPLAAERKKANSPLNPNGINRNPDVMDAYMEAVPFICKAGDDGKYDEAAGCDVGALIVMSRRVHIGMLVAERKYLDDEDGVYNKLVSMGDSPETREAIRQALTAKHVETDIMIRVARKCGRCRLYPPFVLSFFSNMIELTKDIEVEYMFQRVPHATTTA